MSDWTEKFSSLELLKMLRSDFEMLQNDDIDWTELANNMDVSLSVVDELIRRQTSAVKKDDPMQDSNYVGHRIHY